MSLPSDYRWIVVGKLAMRNRAKTPDYAPEFIIPDLIAAATDRINNRDVLRSYWVQLHKGTRGSTGFAGTR